MPWVEVFAVFVVCHLTGDYLLQTDWQALHKRGGLGSDPVARRALLSHIVDLHARLRARARLAGRRHWRPGVIWRGRADRGARTSIQDDGRLLGRYMSRVKRLDPLADPAVAAAVDQTFHYPGPVR